jgi:flagellar hook assembly protein FlgD
MEHPLPKSAIAILLSIVAALGAWVAPVAAAPLSNAKIVIIVGAVHGQTDSFRQRGEAAYAEAIKHSSNVVKVFSPYATWSAVKTATKDASIVVYMGHGNGWPSPYTFDPAYTTKDGFGLNSAANAGDHNVKYYGEPSVATLELAPNAVVILTSLCYASGNPEPGGAAPTVSVARQRVDNYAAGFLKSPARAVIADGHGGAAPYIRAIFTTNQTIESVWKTAPNFHGNVSTFASSRTAGATAYTDTDTPSGGYYRSFVGKPSLTTAEISRRIADTDVDPDGLVVPGRAAVATEGAALAAAPGADSTVALAAGTRLKVVDRPIAATAEAPSIVEVVGLDDPSIVGFMEATALIPRDSTPPSVLSSGTNGSAISPNADGRSDSVSLSASFTESVDWRVRVSKDGTVLHEQTGTGRDAAATWDGLAAGVAVPDGSYTYAIVGTDAWKNAPATATGTIRVDTKAPDLSAVPAAPATVPVISPNGDGVADTISFSGSTSEAGEIAVRVRTGQTFVRSYAVKVGAGPLAVSWNGRSDAGDVVPDGTYDVRLTPRDAVGNSGPTVTRQVKVLTILGSVATSRARFFPQDLDDLAPRTYLSFTLTRAATVDWTLRGADGKVAATRYAGESLPAGTYTWNFSGRTADGTMLPTGRYRSVVSVDDGTDMASQSIPFVMDAFSIGTSTATPTRGRTVTITAISAEALSTTPLVYITQPGTATWSVKLTKTATLTYKATITLKASASAGTVRFRVVARDSGGRVQASSIALPLR